MFVVFDFDIFLRFEEGIYGGWERGEVVVLGWMFSVDVRKGFL